MELRDQIKKAMPDTRAVGLADNGATRFQCGTCEYFDSGICRNKHPKLDGTKVDEDWCCNLYDHEGMEIVIA